MWFSISHYPIKAHHSAMYSFRVLTWQTCLLVFCSGSVKRPLPLWHISRTCFTNCVLIKETYLDLDRKKLPVERALGMYWDTESDTFGFRVIVINGTFTRRSILSTVGLVYDPFGLLTPFILKAKQIPQQLFKDQSFCKNLRHNGQEFKNNLAPSSQMTLKCGEKLLLPVL